MMIPVSKSQFGRQVGKLVKCLKAQNITWKEFEWVDDSCVEIEFSNEVVVQAYIDDKNKIMFDIGAIEQSGGSHWEPPDYDFVSIRSTEMVFNAAAEVITLPAFWEAQYKIESYFMEPPNVTIFEE